MIRARIARWRAERHRQRVEDAMDRALSRGAPVEAIQPTPLDDQTTLRYPGRSTYEAQGLAQLEVDFWRGRP